jgi:ketosteroid isomerase-like protein
VAARHNRRAMGRLLPTTNLDLVRSIYAAWERGDYSSAAWLDPTVEFEIADGPDAGSFTGIAEAKTAFREFLGMWDEFRTEAEEYRELDDERVLVYVHNGGRAKASGLQVGQLMGSKDGANVLVIRNGKVVKFSIYFDRARALADLGLAPEGDAGRASR